MPSGSATRWCARPTPGTPSSRAARGALELLFLFSGTSGDLGGDPTLPSNWIADWRRLYRFAQIGRPDLKPPRGRVQPRAPHRHPARRPALGAADRLLRRRAGRRRARSGPTSPSATSSAPDAQARERPADGRAPAQSGRAGDDADQGPAPRRRRRGRARRAGRADRPPSATPSWRTPRCGSTPARGRAQRRRAHRRRRADRRRDLPPGDGGAASTRSSAARTSAPDLGPATVGSGWPTCSCSPSRARRTCSPRSGTDDPRSSAVCEASSGRIPLRTPCARICLDVGRPSAQFNT